MTSTGLEIPSLSVAPSAALHIPTLVWKILTASCH